MLSLTVAIGALSLTSPGGSSVPSFQQGYLLPMEETFHSWSPYYGSDGSWYIRGGRNVFVKMPDEKTAKKTAKKFNRIEKKEKKANGVWDDGSAPCGDARDGVQC